MLAKYLAGGIAALEPVRREAPAKAGSLTERIEALPWFIPAAQFFYLGTNRTEESGSVPEAIRRTISLPATPRGWSHATLAKFLKRLGVSEPPTCPPALREELLARERATNGKFVPDRIHRQITQRRTVVRQFRHATNAALDFLNAAGSMFFFNDPLTGQRRPPQPGEVLEGDDSTINFPVCVPWTLGGDPCSEKFGVKVGRFQWLVMIDASSRFVTAWSYVMRPRSSYRAEDALSLMRAHCIQHGVPLQFRFERGVWKSNLVKQAIQGLGVDLHTVWSPHQKPYIEGLFNTLWTKLSVHFPDADVGRFRGETEEANDLLVSCQRGHTDPRKHFPMLSTAIAVFNEVLPEKNVTPVNSDVGSWVPAERFAQLADTVRAWNPDLDFLFSPMAKEWMVRGMLVGGRVPLFEDLSVPFDFSAPWLHEYDGARVRVHFDPSAPRCHGTVVLVEAFHGHRPGEVLGLAQQINEVGNYARMVLGWGGDPQNAGRLARQQAASAMRREVRAVVPRVGGGAYRMSEERDGVSAVTQITNFAADSVPNAGNANCGIQAGTGEPPVRSQNGISIPGRATEVNAPLSQSPLSGRNAISPEQEAEALSRRVAEADAWEKEHALDLI
jgi:hypothetical protein